MSFQITEWFVQQYGGAVITLSQQKMSRLRNRVMVESNVTGKTKFFDRVGSVVAQKRTTRHGDSPINSTPHSRRRASLVTYDTGDLVDAPDKIRTLNDPTNSYVRVHGAAMGRAFDSVILEAAVATAYAGEDGSISVALPSAQKVAQGTASLTLAKLLAAKEILDTNEVDPDEERFIVVTPKMITSLLNTTEVKSADYNSVKALVAGEINTFLGFNFIMSNLNGYDVASSTYRTAIAYAKNGIGLAIGSDIKSRIAERSDKAFAMYVYFAMDIGATRVEDEKVVEIPCLSTD